VLQKAPRPTKSLGEAGAAAAHTLQMANLPEPDR
jgi:hypothetical protein